VLWKLRGVGGLEPSTVRRKQEAWIHGATKRCRLSWLTNSALVNEPKCVSKGGGRGGCGVSTNEYRCTVHMEPK
jgi:hypothetical protein